MFFPCRTLQTVGPSHARTYTVAVYFKGERIGCGKGPRYEKGHLFHWVCVRVQGSPHLVFQNSAVCIAQLECGVSAIIAKWIRGLMSPPSPLQSWVISPGQGMPLYGAWPCGENCICGRHICSVPFQICTGCHGVDGTAIRHFISYHFSSGHSYHFLRKRIIFIISFLWAL